MAAILGAGLGGLSAAYYLIKKGLNGKLPLYIIEASSGCGGWVKSVRTENYVFEQGPRTIRPKGEIGTNTLNLIEDLGLSDYVYPITSEHPAAKNRMIYANQKLHTLPSSLMSVFGKTTPFTKPLIYAALYDWRQPAETKDDDSIYGFVERRFGKEIADYAISPMICGICAGDAKEISVKFLMRSLFEYEQDHGGVVKGLLKSMMKKPETKYKIPQGALASTAKDDHWSVYTLRGGLQLLPETLSKHVLKNHNVKINYETKIKQIEFFNSGTIEVQCSGDTPMEARHIYSAIPSYQLADLLQKQHPELSDDLRQIPFVTVGIVNFYFANDSNIVPPAFGFLVPPIEKIPILGVVFDSCCLPDQNGTVLTVMIGGKWFDTIFGANPSEIDVYDVAMKELTKILKIKTKPTSYHVNILNKCIPQYVVGHYERVEKMRKYIIDKQLPLTLVGSSYDGVGINDVIYSAKSQVEQDFSFI